jgi:hypothetical protein
VKTVALVIAAFVAGGTSASKPALRPLDLDPLTLRGTSFKAGERVKLLLSAPPAVRSKVVRAGGRGRFRVVFALKAGRCESIVVQAIGSRGSRATFRHDAPGCVDP